MTRSSKTLRSTCRAGLAAALLTLVSAMDAPAATHDIEILRLTAGWENPQGSAWPGARPPSIDPPGSNGEPVSIHWSTRIPNLSDIHTGFVITPGSGLGLSLGETGILASLRMLNGTISAYGFLLEQVELSMEIEGHANGPVNQPLVMPLSFLLTYEDTPNRASLCPDWHSGDRPCDDRATITMLSDSNVTLNGEGASYTFEVMGFALDGEIRDSVLLPEETETELHLMARLTGNGPATPVIPLPPALGLLASGLGLLVLMRRARRRLDTPSPTV